jgi:hypothetical protein
MPNEYAAHTKAWKRVPIEVSGRTNARLGSGSTPHFGL